MQDVYFYFAAAAAFAAILIAGLTIILSDNKQQVSPQALDFLAFNFIALCDGTKKPAQLVTVASLTAARAQFPEHQAEIAEIIAKIASIGHDINDDPRAQTAVAMGTTPFSSYASAVVPSAFAVYAIDRRDLAEARE